MFKYIGCKDFTITKVLAEKWRDKQTIQEDRPTSKSHLEKLRKEFVAGKIVKFHWACGVLPNGEEYRVNGKHSATVLADLEPFPVDMIAGIERYSCSNMNAVVELYSTFDARFMGRSQRDVNRAVLASNPLYKQVTPRFFDCCQAGIMNFNFGYDSTGVQKISPSDRAKMTIAETDFLLFFASMIVDGDSKKWFLRASVASAMFRTFSKDRAEALKFWTAVRDGSDNPKTKPTRVLGRYLNDTVIKNSGQLRGDKQTDMASSMDYNCVKAWNAWRKGIEVKISVGAENLPSII